MINGAEGSKDAFHSLVKYAPYMPNEVYYDFACQLKEYTMNREPALFKDTRFWSDVFHTVNHTACGDNFKSRRIPCLGITNSEIAEQCNSFLRRLKSSGSHLSQPHFMFFVEFFLAVWNTSKTKSYDADAAFTAATLADVTD